MNSASKKAILVVSFGTSYENTRKLTIEAIEHDIADAFPACPTYRAWTSKMIIAKLKKRDGLTIHTVKEALEQMLLDGITDVIVQPTHVINGIENDLMKEDVLAYADHFDSIRFGTPLLTSTKDIEEAIRAFMEDWKDLPEKEALVLMGHGTTHYANTAYAALDYTFKDLGYSNVLIGTVEAYPSIPSILRGLKELQPEKIHLTPFMIVAGDHATNDMAGEEEDSWKNQFEAAGYTVECHLKGLGEYEGIRKIFLKHIEESK